MPAADAVGDRVERLAVVVLPLGLEHVVDDLAGIGREPCGGGGSVREPDGAEVGEQRLALRDADQRGRAGERHPSGGEQRLRLVG